MHRWLPPPTDRLLLLRNSLSKADKVSADTGETRVHDRPDLSIARAAALFWSGHANRSETAWALNDYGYQTVGRPPRKTPWTDEGRVDPIHTRTTKRRDDPKYTKN